MHRIKRHHQVSPSKYYKVRQVLQSMALLQSELVQYLLFRTESVKVFWADGMLGNRDGSSKNTKRRKICYSSGKLQGTRLDGNMSSFRSWSQRICWQKNTRFTEAAWFHSLRIGQVGQTYWRNCWECKVVHLEQEGRCMNRVSHHVGWIPRGRCPRLYGLSRLGGETEYAIEVTAWWIQYHQYQRGSPETEWLALQLILVRLYFLCKHFQLWN